MEKPSVKTHLSKHAVNAHASLHSHSHTRIHFPPSAGFKVTTAAASFRIFIQGRRHQRTPLCGKADAAAFHTDFQAIRGLAADIHDAAVHVTGAVAVVTQVVGAAAAAASLRRARATRGLGYHHVAKRQEFAEKAGQDAVNAAVWVQVSQSERQGVK